MTMMIRQMNHMQTQNRDLQTKLDEQQKLGERRRGDMNVDREKYRARAGSIGAASRAGPAGSAGPAGPAYSSGFQSPVSHRGVGSLAEAPPKHSPEDERRWAQERAEQDQLSADNAAVARKQAEQEGFVPEPGSVQWVQVQNKDGTFS